MTDDVGSSAARGDRGARDDPGRRSSPAAVDTFVAGQRLDMRSLARRLGVARATLYRRAGNREQLLDELLWWRARLLLADQVRASAELAGTERLVAVIGGVLRAHRRDRPLRAFLESDPETALRVLTGTRSTVHQGMASRAGEAHRPGTRPRALRRQPGYPDAGLRDRPRSPRVSSTPT